MLAEELEEDKQMKRVTVHVYGGTIAEKILVEDRGDVLLLTTETEWRAAERESRQPIVVGFRREYVAARTLED